MATSSASALSLRQITKRFGDTTALADGTLELATGTVHALLGENGAGKTTLMRIAFGLVRPDAGSVLLGGASARFHSPADAIASGIGMVHQHFTSVPGMTVAENVALGRHGRYDARAARHRVLALAEQTGLALDPDAIAGELPVSALQRLEIVKALAAGARILILDEPTAVLAPAEADDLVQTMRAFAAGGGAVVLITHKLREALAAADHVTVLRRGRTVLQASARDVAERDLVAAMLGNDTELGVRTISAMRAIPGALLVAARGISVRDARGVIRVRDASFELHAGEIVGIAAVEGAGQHELLRAVAGLIAPSAGSLTHHGQIAFIPEDRQRDGLILDFTLSENVALRGAAMRRGRMDWDAIASRTSSLLAHHDVRAVGPAALARSLSGGNQQKLVLARELAGAPAVVLAENPTRGLDVGATAATHGCLRAARDAGAAVLVYSSDLDEVLALADRVLVMHAGQMSDVALDRDAVGRAMLGAS
ncbi:MAG: ABC transporter ATP-binding protein [Gemmatimonadaceae bacterium]